MKYKMKFNFVKFPLIINKFQMKILLNYHSCSFIKINHIFMSISDMFYSIILLNLLSICAAYPFSPIPIVYANLTTTPSFLKIASNQSMIVIVFGTNELMGYNFQGQNTVQFNTANIGQIQSLSWVDGVGPIVVASGTAYVWYANGTYITSQSLAPGVSISLMATSSSGGIPYISLASSNYQNVSEYKFVNGQFVFEQYYYLPSVEPWAMMYSPGREYFFVSTSISQVYFQSLVVNFNCSTGDNDGANPYFVTAGSFVDSFAPYANGTYLFTDDDFIYTFSMMDQGIYVTNIGTPEASPRSMVYCPGTNFFAISADSSNYTLVIYEQTLIGGQQTLQALQFFSGAQIPIDCSANYLVYVNNTNNLIITTYSNSTGPNNSTGSSFPVWAIAIIVTLSLLFLTAIGVFVFLLVKKRKKDQNRTIGLNKNSVKELLINSPNQQTGRQYGNIYQYQPQNQYPISNQNNYQVEYPSQAQTMYPNQPQNQYQNESLFINQYQNGQTNNRYLENNKMQIQPESKNPNFGNVEFKVNFETTNINPMVRNQIELNPAIKLEIQRENESK